MISVTKKTKYRSDMLLLALVTLLTGFASGLHSNLESKYSCPHGWTRFGSKKCLKYINELQDFERAQSICRAKNQGNLVSIHSHEEQNFVYSYIHSIAASSTPVWLGAKQIDFESILWLDKTENSYTNWAPSEPSHPDEICIAINPRNGMWHDVMCTEANVPACERAPTTQWPFFVAFCSEGWFQFNDEKCVRIISSQALNFYESQELCRSKYNSKLLSIKTDRESEFLHNLIKFRDVKLPVWLGAVQNDFSSFNWIDKTDVTFTNWAEGEPNDPDHACLSMTAAGGKWSDNDCKEQKLILCQKVPEDSSCETGWLQFRQDKCYRFVHIRLAFDDAESLCNNLYGGHLPSVHSQEEQFMISQFLASVNVKNGSEIWLGGRQMDFHNFNWGDGSLFNYSYWEHGEPNFPAEKCIEMSWRSGRWNDISCRLRRAVLCERQVINKNSLSQQRPNLYQSSNCLDFNCTANPIISIGSASVTEISIPSDLLDQTHDQAAHPVFNSEPSLAVLAQPPQNQPNGFRDFGAHSSPDSTITLQNRTKPSIQVQESSVTPVGQESIKAITSLIQRHLQSTKPQVGASLPSSTVNETISDAGGATTDTTCTTQHPPQSQKQASHKVATSLETAKAVHAGARKEQIIETAKSDAKSTSSVIQQTFDNPNTSSLLDKLVSETVVSTMPTTTSTQNNTTPFGSTAVWDLQSASPLQQQNLSNSSTVRPLEGFGVNGTQASNATSTSDKQLQLTTASVSNAKP